MKIIEVCKEMLWHEWIQFMGSLTEQRSKTSCLYGEGA